MAFLVVVRKFLFVIGLLIAVNVFIVYRIDFDATERDASSHYILARRSAKQMMTLTTISPKQLLVTSSAVVMKKRNTTTKTTTTIEHNRTVAVPPAFTTVHSCQLPDNQTATIPTVPYLIIIGAQKAGTTSMAQWLQNHPQVIPGRFPNRKESHFFHGVFAGLLEERKQGKWEGSDEEFYCRARLRYAEVVFDIPTLLQGMEGNGMPMKKNPVITVDKTPAYIHLKHCAEYVAKTCPWGVKILVLVRNPVERAYSQHQMDVRSKKHTSWPCFEERLRKEVRRMRELGFNHMPILPPENVTTMNDIDALDFPPLNVSAEHEQEAFEHFVNMPLIKKGLYAVQLREWIKWIPKSNIIIQKYEDLKRDPDATYRALQRQLGLKDHSLSVYSHNQAGTYSTPMMNTTRRYLERFFEPYNRQMIELFGPQWEGVWDN